MRRICVVAAGLTALALSACVSTRYTLRPLDLPPDLDAYLVAREGEVPGLIPGVEREILWAGEPGEKTPLAIVYIHGWQGSRREYAEVFDPVARELGANLYYARLSGYGSTPDAVAGVKLDDWINDTWEAMEIGRRIGDRVVVAGSSMGGDLALWLATRAPEELAAVVLLSCAVQPSDKRSEMLLWPWPLRNLIRALALGRYSENDFREDLYPTGSSRLFELYNPPRYRSVSTMKLMSVVKLVRGLDLGTITAPTLWLYSEKDDAVDVPTIKAYYERAGGQGKSLVHVEGARAHMLAGDMFSPDTTTEVVNAVLAFLRRTL